MATARDERIEQIFRRGLEAQRRAFDPERHLVASGPVDANGRRPFRTSQSVWFAHALLRESPAGAAGAAVPAVSTSAAAPDFTLRALEGPNVRLQELRGRVGSLNLGEVQVVDADGKPVAAAAAPAADAAKKK